MRLARPEERVRWDQRVDQHHYLGFKRFAGRGLRYIVEWRGQWLALAGWQSGAFKSRHRDRWVGWKRELRYRRLHLIGNNTRFVILSRPFFLISPPGQLAADAASSQDWQAAAGHPLLIGETRDFQGTLYQAAKHIWATSGVCAAQRPLHRPAASRSGSMSTRQRNARRRLRDPRPLPPAWEPKGHSERAESELRSL